jgi:hypothetical protein
MARKAGQIQIPKTGRPQGSQNIKPVVDVKLSQCPSCGSTERSRYVGASTEHEYRGIAPDGLSYTHIVRRRTRCECCGQWRIDRTFENRKTMPKPDESTEFTESAETAESTE